MNLHDAYARAVYVVDYEGTRIAFTFSQDRAVPVVLPLSEPWAIITACNPRSVRLSDAENAARMGVLRDRLARDGVAFLTAEGRNPHTESSHTWREPSVLVEHVTREYVLALLGDFDQHAAVFGEAGQTGLLYADGTFIVMTPLTAAIP